MQCQENADKIHHLQLEQVASQALPLSSKPKMAQPSKMVQQLPTTLNLHHQESFHIYEDYKIYEDWSTATYNDYISVL
jgi:hypothetical protein